MPRGGFAVGDSARGGFLPVPVRPYRQPEISYLVEHTTAPEDIVRMNNVEVHVADLVSLSRQRLSRTVRGVHDGG